jgi:hypothetical protein
LFIRISFGLIFIPSIWCGFIVYCHLQRNKSLWH